MISARWLEIYLKYRIEHKVVILYLKYFESPHTTGYVRKCQQNIEKNRRIGKYQPSGSPPAARGSLRPSSSNKKCWNNIVVTAFSKLFVKVLLNPIGPKSQTAFPLTFQISGAELHRMLIYQFDNCGHDGVCCSKRGEKFSG